MEIKNIKHFVCAASFLMATFCAFAQIPEALDVTCSVALRDANGAVLAGNNPLSGAGYVPGGRVQLLSVGANGKVDLPLVAGEAGGDDLLIAQSSIGQGMILAMSQSGRFTFSIIPAPSEGSKLYVRAFNHADPSLASSWGQSAVQALGSAKVLDVGQLGLNQTSIPTSGDVATTDTDGDGLTDLQELVANTNAQSGSEAFAASPLGSGFAFQVQGSAGRDYVLLRTLALDPLSWAEVARSGILATDQSFILEDANPPVNKAVYKVGVSFPELN